MLTGLLMCPHLPVRSSVGAITLDSFCFPRCFPTLTMLRRFTAVSLPPPTPPSSLRLAPATAPAALRAARSCCSACRARARSICRRPLPRAAGLHRRRRFCGLRRSPQLCFLLPRRLFSDLVRLCIDTARRLFSDLVRLCVDSAPVLC
jgi:hypothetical protein